MLLLDMRVQNLGREDRLQVWDTLVEQPTFRDHLIAFLLAEAAHEEDKVMNNAAYQLPEHMTSSNQLHVDHVVGTLLVGHHWVRLMAVVVSHQQ